MYKARWKSIRKHGELIGVKDYRDRYYQVEAFRLGLVRNRENKKFYSDVLQFN